MDETKKAVGYLRVSTTKQAEEGISLEAQEAKIEAWAVLQGFELIGIFKDAGISGGKMNNRPGLKMAIAAACKNKAALVFYSLSRLCRSVPDAYSIGQRLEKGNADMISLTEPLDTRSAMGKAFFGFMAIMAQLERDITSERTKTVLQHLREQGKRIGGQLPYGFDADEDGNLIENEEEQEGLKLIRALRAKGETLQAIARELEKRGIKTKRGKAKWTHQAVRSILKRGKFKAAM